MADRKGDVAADGGILETHLEICMMRHPAGSPSGRRPARRRWFARGWAKFCACIVLVGLLIWTASTLPALNASKDESDRVAAAPEMGADSASDPQTIFGSSLGRSSSDETFQAAVDYTDRNLGDVRVVRYFEPHMPVEWSKRLPELVGKTILVSFRPEPADVLSGSHDKALLEWFEAAPTDQDVYWSYWHEPEPDIASGKFSAEAYRAAWRHISKLAAQAENPRLHSTLILMGWTVDPYSQRKWRTYYPGDAYIDVLGWDVYNDAHSVAGPSGYPSPSSLFDDVVRVSKAADKPFGIAETGSRLVPSDRSGTQRAAWLTNLGRYLKNNDAVFVAYWNSVDKGDFRLLDKPSQNAWRTLVEGG